MADNYSKSEAIRIADKLMGLRLEGVIIRIAEAVNQGASPRIVDVLIEAAKAKFDESLEYALKGKVKL